MKLRAFFVDGLGVAEVYDLGWFNQVALELSYLEFEGRFLKSAKYDPEKMAKVKKGIKWNRQIGDLPILTSECPGWVCYAEKTVGDDAFPFMSRVKSPQQICGKILKSTQMGQNVKFVTIMPCYDKKLEAVRPTMLVPNADQPDSLR